MKKRLCIFLAIVFCILSIGAPAFAANEDLEAQYNAIANSINSLKSSIDTTQTTISGIQSEIDKSNATIEEINTQVAALDQTIGALDSRMAETKAQITELEAQKAVLEAELEERLRVMYMYGNDGYVQMLFSAENLTDLLTRVDLMKNVMTADRDAVTELESVQKQLNDGIASVEADKASVEQVKKAQTDAKAIQESLKAQQAQLLAQNQATIDALKSELEAELSTGNELAATLGKSSFGTIQTGDYYWPIDPSNEKAFHISSVFGNRPYPGGGGSTNHQGIDVTPGAGTPILAVADGLVTVAGPYGGYGNCVVLDMGTDTSGQALGTIYGHMQSVATSVGATVKKGDVIGYVGSTGNSTGPHLHLSWTVNGSMVDPMNYYPQYESKYVYVD